MVETDLIERLRAHPWAAHDGLRREAADEIERLSRYIALSQKQYLKQEKEIERLRAAGQAVIHAWDERDDAMPLHRAMDALGKTLENEK